MAIIPITALTNLTLNANLQSGGWSGNATGLNIGQYLLPDRFIQIDIKDLLLGTWDDYVKTLIRAYIPGDSIKIDWEKGEASFSLNTAQYYAEKMNLAPMVYVQGGGEHVHKPTSLTHAYIIRHILEAHTNFMQYVAVDIESAGFTFQEYTIEESTLWGIIKQSAQDDMKVCYFDRNNIFHFVRHPAFVGDKFHSVSSWVTGIINTYRSDVVPAVRAAGFWEDATDGQCIYEWWWRWHVPEFTYFNGSIEAYCESLSGQTRPATSDAIMTFTNSLCTELNIERRSERQCSQVYAQGFLHNPTERVEVLYPRAPDPSGGEIVQLSGIPVGSQNDINTFAKRHFMWRNRDWTVRIKDFRNHHLDLGDIIGVTYTDIDEDIYWDNKLFIIEGINYDFQWSDGIPKLSSEYTCEELA